MLRDELPGWLRSRGLATATGGLPATVLGISMGGSGALQYALGRADRPPDAVALLSPALFRTWADARTAGGYDDQADWRAHEPLLRLEGSRPPRVAATLGVWCGAEDPFCPAARELAAATRADEAQFPAGAHTEGFWRRVMPDALALVGAPRR
jgi:S-formylglutathione hydrolase FrmB